MQTDTSIARANLRVEPPSISFRYGSLWRTKISLQDRVGAPSFSRYEAIARLQTVSSDPSVQDKVRGARIEVGPHRYDLARQQRPRQMASTLETIR